MRKFWLGLFLLFLIFSGCGKTGTSATNVDLRFAVLTDSQGINTIYPVNTLVLLPIINRLLDFNPRPSFVLFCGDATYSGRSAQLAQWNSAVSGLTDNGITIYPAKGNHEMASETGYANDQQDYLNNISMPDNGPPGYSELAYYFESGNVLFVCLDAYYFDGSNLFYNEITPAEQSWLDDVLKSSTKTFKIVFAHAPAYSSGGHLGTCLDANPEKRDAFWKILDDNQVDLYFAGHEHLYSRWTITPAVNPAANHRVTQIVAGLCGGAPYPIGTGSNPDVVRSIYNYALVDIKGNSLTLTAYDYQGNIIDTFSINK